VEVDVAGKYVMRVYHRIQRDICSPMDKPRSRIVRDETYCNVIPCRSHTYGVSPDWVDEVWCVVACNSNDSKFVLSAALERGMTQKTESRRTP
jgi:hypothetical protein